MPRPRFACNTPQSFRDELRETSKYLDPVQRAQLLTMRERLMRRVREVRSERGRREGTGEGYALPPPGTGPRLGRGAHALSRGPG